MVMWIFGSVLCALLMTLFGVEKPYVGLTLTAGLCGPMLFFTMVLYVWLRSLLAACRVERESVENDSCGIPRICQSLKSAMVYSGTSLILLLSCSLLTLYSHTWNHTTFVCGLISLLILCLIHAMMPILFLDLAVIHGVVAAICGVQCLLLMLCSSTSFLTWIPMWIGYGLVVLFSLISAFKSGPQKPEVMFTTIPRVISTKAQKLTFPFISLFCCAGHILLLKQHEKIGIGLFFLAIAFFAAAIGPSLIQHLDYLIDEVTFTEPRGEKEPLLPDSD